MGEFDYADAWRPDVGDVVKGTVVAIDSRTGEFDAYPIITIRDEDGGERAVHAFHTALHQQLGDLDVQVGDEIAVQYRGKQQTRDGKRSYEAYRVKKHTAETARVNWAATPPAGDVPIDTPEPPATTVDDDGPIRF